MKNSYRERFVSVNPSNPNSPMVPEKMLRRGKHHHKEHFEEAKPTKMMPTADNMNPLGKYPSFPNQGEMTHFDASNHESAKQAYGEYTDFDKMCMYKYGRDCMSSALNHCDKDLGGQPDYRTCVSSYYNSCMSPENKQGTKSMDPKLGDFTVTDPISYCLWRNSVAHNKVKEYNEKYIADDKTKMLNTLSHGIYNATRFFPQVPMI